MFLLTGNLAYIASTTHLLKNIKNSFLFFSVYAGFSVGFYLSNKFIFLPLSKVIANSEYNKPIKWLSIFGQLAFLAVFLKFTVFPLNIYKPKSKAIKTVQIHQIKSKTLFSNEQIKSLKPYPKSYKQAISNLSPYLKLIHDVEKKYNIKTNVLAALILQESKGYPLALNFSNDGGAGLMMFQPGVARHYGLKIYGNSKKTGADYSHGLSLRKLVRKYNNNYEKLSLVDERFDIYKSIDAGARYLRDLYKRYRSWDKAISAYNQGKSAKYPFLTRHVSLVNLYLVMLNKEQGINDTGLFSDKLISISGHKIKKANKKSADGFLISTYFIRRGTTLSGLTKLLKNRHAYFINKGYQILLTDKHNKPLNKLYANTYAYVYLVKSSKAPALKNPTYQPVLAKIKNPTRQHSIAKIKNPNSNLKIRYAVKKGDTVLKIIEKFKSKYPNYAKTHYFILTDKHNRILINKIYAGSYVYLHIKPNNQEIAYVVKKGDTVYKIKRQLKQLFGKNANIILKHNNQIVRNKLYANSIISVHIKK